MRSLLETDMARKVQTPIGEMLLTPIQDDCLRRGGRCEAHLGLDACNHGKIMESARCQVNKSKEVKALLEYRSSRVDNRNDMWYVELVLQTAEEDSREHESDENPQEPDVRLRRDTSLHDEQ